MCLAHVTSDMTRRMMLQVPTSARRIDLDNDDDAFAETESADDAAEDGLKLQDLAQVLAVLGFRALAVDKADISVPVTAYLWCG